MTEPFPAIIALFGPTAVGKTEVAIAVAERLVASGERPVAVSADAYQLYRGLETLSGAPTPEQRARLEHLFIGSHDLEEQMSAGRFAGEARPAIDAAIAEGRRPIVVGGAGLYMQAALTDLEMRGPAGIVDPAEPVDQDTGELHARLREVAPDAAARIDPGDRYRSGRALALAEQGGEPDPGGAFWDAALRHPTASFGLVRDREELYRRIDERVAAIAAAGGVEEVREAAHASPTARKAIGFEELPAGNLEAMKARTRRYAKRQLTWLRRMPSLHLVDLSALSVDEAADRIVESTAGPQ